MSWRDTYTGGAKFRNVAFLVKSSSTQFGRRVAVHEYPKRDVPYVEDMGLKAREFTLEAFVIGENYHTQRDALMDAIDKPGAATLVHPYLGTTRVNVIDARQREDSTHGGRCQFTLTLMVAGENKYPDQQIDTQALVDLKADVALSSILEDFAGKFEIVGMISSHVDELSSVLDGVVGDISAQLGSVLDPLNSLMAEPLKLASSLMGSVGDISSVLTAVPANFVGNVVGDFAGGFAGNLASEFVSEKLAEINPANAFKRYTTLFDTGASATSIVATMVSRQIQQKSTNALHKLVQHTSLVEAARSSSLINFAAYDDAIDVRDRLLDQFDVQMRDESISDAVFGAFADLKTTVVNDIRVRGADLSKLASHIPQVVQSPLVVAYELFGDANREQELVERNKGSHPGLMPAGARLEVLNV